MSTESKVFLKEEVLNKNRAFGSSDVYYPAYVVLVDGKEVPALFTLEQLKVAMERADRKSVV